MAGQWWWNARPKRKNIQNFGSMLMKANTMSAAASKMTAPNIFKKEGPKM